MTTGSPITYNERLWPSGWLLVALTLLLPATFIVVFPLNAELSIASAIVVYLAVTAFFTLTAPTIKVANGELTAGKARIPVALISNTQVLDSNELKRTIGPSADARAYLMIRGYVHRAVRVDLQDPADPTPYWVMTTRRPTELANAIEAAKS